MSKPLIINNWQEAIADSPHMGFGLLKNVDIDGFPAAVRPSKKPTTVFHTALSATFTADAATDIITIASGAMPTTGTAITVSTTTTLPAGLTAATNYFVIRLSSTTAKLATTIANANAATAINITDAGTGTHTIVTVNPGTIKHFVNDPRTDVLFMQDSNGVVWYAASNDLFFLLNGNTLTNSGGNGLAILRSSDGNATYLFAFRNNKIDVINVFGTANKETPSWTNGWDFGGAVSDTTLNSGAGSGNSHHSINAQDGIIYFCDDRYIGRIRETPGQIFDPSNTATYSGSDNVLDLPLGALSYWLEELGTNLLISVSNDNKVYPWDRVSDSFSLPLPLPETNVNKMKNIGNVVYILAGTRGNIYQTQGTYVKFFKKIPDYISNNTSGNIVATPITWGGIGAVGDSLLIGAGTQTTGNSGVYLIRPDGRITMDNMPSTGSTNVTALYAVGQEFYKMGYAGGADSFGSAVRYTSYEAIVHSAFFPVATKIEKAIFSRVEFVIAKPVAANVRLSYRTDTTASFTTIDTWTTDTSNTMYSSETIGLTDLENIQVLVELGGNVELVEVRLIP